jgi:hypothetical protein
MAAGLHNCFPWMLALPRTSVHLLPSVGESKVSSNVSALPGVSFTVTEEEAPALTVRSFTVNVTV